MPAKRSLPPGWQTDIIKALGGQYTPAAEHLLGAWQQWEGGHTANSADWNPLNTMRGEYPKMGIGISRYPDWKTGAAETAATLQKEYPALTAAIASGKIDFSNPDLQADFNYWLTGKRTPGMTPYVQKIARSFGADVPLTKSAPSVGKLPPPPAAKPEANGFDFMGVALGKTSPMEQLLGMTFGTREQERTPMTPFEGGAPASGDGGGGGDWTFGSASSWTGGKGENVGNPGQGTHGKNAPGDNWQSKNAYDVAVPVGTPIYAQTDGVVGSNIGAQRSRPDDGMRLEIRVGDDDAYWLGHLSRIVVRAGQPVKRGQLIGYSGKSQNGVAHLHISRQKGWG